ncbi:nucleotide pyrophosphohydrolase [Lysobacter sp. 2RAF19]
MANDIQQLQERLTAFAHERDWDQFHTPRNLATALSVEAAEILEHFQWLTDAQAQTLPDTKRAAVGEELADVLLYLVQLARKLDVDLVRAANEKIEKNAVKYPVEKAKGRADKYTDL